MDHSLPADCRRLAQIDRFAPSESMDSHPRSGSSATIPVPTGTSSFELGMLVVDLLVRDYGAQVIGYDASPERASVELRLPRRNL